MKHNLREASSRLILKLKELNVSMVVTKKLLPCAFVHHETVQEMLKNGVPMDKLAQTYLMNECAIHPAVRNRQSEIDYLRAVAKCLLPRIYNNSNLNSKVFFSLVRELLACWVLLPLMDALSDPNLINSIIIAATNHSSTSVRKSASASDKVMFLKNFVEKRGGDEECSHFVDEADTSFLKDQHQLYMFMQFLKRENAVDILRFYLDVDNLNSELTDPKITTDPKKLSSLQQQSEALLLSYQTMMKRDFKEPVGTLLEAQEDVKRCLQEKWLKTFHSTSEYFRLVYGHRDIKECVEAKNADAHPGAVSKIGLKLKGAIRGAIDGAPLEATEVPTVWDAFADEPQVN